MWILLHIRLFTFIVCEEDEVNVNDECLKKVGISEPCEVRYSYFSSQ